MRSNANQSVCMQHPWCHSMHVQGAPAACATACVCRAHLQHAADTQSTHFHLHMHMPDAKCSVLTPRDTCTCTQQALPAPAPACSRPYLHLHLHTAGATCSTLFMLLTHTAGPTCSTLFMKQVLPRLLRPRRPRGKPSAGAAAGVAYRQAGGAEWWLPQHSSACNTHPALCSFNAYHYTV